MFSVISMMVSMMVTPLWPAYGEAISSGDIQWVRRTLGRSLRWVFGLSMAAAAGMLLIARPVLSWWVGSTIAPPFILLLGLALWTVTDCCGTTIAMFLNGAGIMRFQIVTASVFGVGCLGAKVYLDQPLRGCRGPMGNAADLSPYFDAFRSDLCAARTAASDPRGQSGDRRHARDRGIGRSFHQAWPLLAARGKSPSNRKRQAEPPVRTTKGC